MILLTLATLLAASPPDSFATYVAVAPAESLRVTSMGPPTGPTVVIIPGLLSPAYGFRKILPRLAQLGVRGIVVEPLGVGWSSRPGDADYSHTAQGNRIAAAMDSLHVSHAVLFAHSVGATMALRLATQRPGLVDGLLLMDGAAVESPAVSGVKSALKFAWLIKLFSGRGRVRKEVRQGLLAASGDTTWISDEVIDGYTAGPAGDIGAVLRALKGMNDATEPDSLRPKLPGLKIPARMLVGGAAHRGGAGDGRIRTLRGLMPQMTMRVVFGAGLYIHEEQPEVVVKEVVDFLHTVDP
jgi:pimeloyl-ACP methyl ester carboxylesterase